jgi:fructokinase
MPTLSLSDGTPDDFAGTCPFHGRCLEGLASGTALAARAGDDPAGLPEDHPVWELQARQLAHGLAAAVLVASPERIVLGGGVMGHPGLLQRVRRELSSTLAGYVPRSELGAGIDRYVVPPAFDDAGLVGALFLASEQGGARSVAFP